MALTSKKIVIPDGVPDVDGQDMKSTIWEVTDDDRLGNGNYEITKDTGNKGEVLTLDENNIASFKQIPRVNSTIYTGSTNENPPPSDGQIRWNASPQNTATKLYVSNVNDDGDNIENYLGLVLKPGAQIFIQNDGDPDNYQLWDIQATTPDVGYYDVDVTLADDNGGDLPTGFFGGDIIFTVLSGTSAAAVAVDRNSDFNVSNNGVANNIYRVDCSLGDVTVTLPDPSTISNQVHDFIKTDSTNNKIIIDGDGFNINDDPTDRVVSQYDSLAIIPNGGLFYKFSEKLNEKFLAVNRDGSGNQSIPSGVRTVIQFTNVLADGINGFDPITNYDWTPGNGIFMFNISAEIENLDSNDFVELCLRKNGSVIACGRIYATRNNQEVVVRLTDVDNNTDPGPGVYDVTIEHDQGGNLNLVDNPLTVFLKVLRIGG